MPFSNVDFRDVILTFGQCLINARLVARMAYTLTNIERVALQSAVRTIDTSTRVAKDICASDHINRAAGPGHSTNPYIPVARNIYA